jgi:hypothetical protein
MEQMKKTHYFNSEAARQKAVYFSTGPIRVQIIKKARSAYNAFCLAEGIIVDIQKFEWIWVRLDGSCPKRAKILKLPFDHVRILSSK